MSRRMQKTLVVIALAGAVLAGLAGPAFMWCLVLLPAWVLVLLIVPRLAGVRPSMRHVRAGIVLSVLAGIVFGTSMLVSIELSTSSSEVWRFGGAGISRTTFQTRLPQYPNAPQLTIGWRPCLCPLGASFVAMGDGRGGSSRTDSRATWPLLTSTALPTFVLWRLRRDRVPPGMCKRCGYNLTGNLSGTCPECGDTR
ncbi:MAG: hypothetical protein JXB13_01295 [Phycisphaerae bacterium]|nr:hypothetical protein [Phycisphaerae bacterium]